MWDGIDELSPLSPVLSPTLKTKSEPKREKDEIVSQCPECRTLKVFKATAVYGTASVPSVALFGDNVKKELCDGCIKKIALALDL